MANEAPILYPKDYYLNTFIYKSTQTIIHRSKNDSETIGMFL